jgi:NADPH-dependent glutamate synthase beta subunit-like oxidoreductase
MGKEVNIGKDVLVIGGGNVAVDVALTAKRKGAQNVTMICLEKRDEMPAWEHEIKDAIDERYPNREQLWPESLFCRGGFRPGVGARVQILHGGI